jgi:hypothetical protein
MQEQCKYYEDRQREHETATQRLRYAGLGMALLGALFGALAAAGLTGFAPWIGLTTSVAAAIGAWGYMARRSVLAATYGTMAYQLGILCDRAGTATRPLPEIVTETENLLRAEHSEWLLAMQQGLVQMRKKAVPPRRRPNRNDAVHQTEKRRRARPDAVGTARC